MSVKRLFPRIFYGWFVVLGCALTIGVSLGFFSNCAGVFTKPVCESLGISRGVFTLYPTFSTLFSTVAIVVYGRLFPKHGVRPFMMLGCLACCLCYLGYSFATQAWHFYAVAALYGCFSPVTMGIAIATLISNWFVGRKGLATGLAFTGSGIGATVMMPVLSRVVDLQGWRAGYRLLAACGLVVFFVATVLLIRDKPSDLGLAPLGELTEKEAPNASLPPKKGVPYVQAVRSRALWLFLTGYALLCIVSTGISPHVIAYLSDLGWTASQSARVMSLAMAVLTAAVVVLGAVFDKTSSVLSSFLTGLCVLLSSVTLALSAAWHDAAWLFSLCFGFGYATLSVPFAYLVGENFGVRDYSAIYSYCYVPANISRALGGSIAGFFFDWFHSYRQVWGIFIVLSLFSTFLLVAAALDARSKGLRDWEPLEDA